MASATMAILFLQAVVWVVGCGIICGVVAEQKGLNVAGWFIAGLLFNGVAVILILVIQEPARKTQQYRKRYPRSERMPPVETAALKPTADDVDAELDSRM